MSPRRILIQYCLYFGRIYHLYVPQDILNTEQPQQNHAQSSHLAAKLI